MKILVTGGSGVIGSYIVQGCLERKIDVEFTFLKHTFETRNAGHNLDITNKNDVLSLIAKIKPDIVIHTVALTNVDLCENNKPLANSINVEGTTNVVDACKKTGANIIYVSTSSVFDGKKEKYVETDKPNPTTNYGITKLRGEEIVTNSGIQHMILRTDQPYCWTEKWQHTNSVLRVLDKIGNHQTLNEITDWRNTPTYVPDFVRVLFSLINKNSQGIFHAVGSDFISRFEWSLRVAEIFRLDKKLILPIQSDSLGLAVKRSNVYLSNDKVFNMIGIRMIGTIEGLNNMKSEIKQIKNSKYQDLLNT